MRWKSSPTIPPADVLIRTGRNAIQPSLDLQLGPHDRTPSLPRISVTVTVQVRGGTPKYCDAFSFYSLCAVGQVKEQREVVAPRNQQLSQSRKMPSMSVHVLNSKK